MKNRTKAILCTVSVIGVVGISGIMAYLTDVDTKTNNFTIGKVEIDLQEPEWDSADDTNKDGIPDYAENLSANATITKDPKVQNTGKNDAYVYLKVTVPVEKVITADEEGNIQNDGEARDTELFTFSTNSKWKQIGSKQENTEDNEDEEGERKVVSCTYIYYYQDALAPDAVTESLFVDDKVKFANIIEDELALQECEIDIEAYAIQSDNLPEGTTIEDAYNIYLKQNEKN